MPRYRTKAEVAQAEWQRILVAFNYSCAYCGASGDDLILCKEHMTPRSRGGGDELENIVPSCVSCNSSKGNMTPLEWFLVELGWLRITSKRADGLRLAEPAPPPFGPERNAILTTYGKPVPVVVTGETPQFYCFRVEQFYRPFVTRWLWPEREYKARKEFVVFAEDAASHTPLPERDRHAGDPNG